VKISKTCKYLNLEQKLKNSGFIQSVFNKILLICLNDKSLLDTDKKDNLVNSQINELQQKINKQDSLLEQSKKLQENFSKKISFIDNENYRLKIELLESLGIE